MDSISDKRKLRMSYRRMMSRCYDSRNASYETHGGRGIIVCEDWRTNFLKFYNWAIENGWESNLTLDRFPNNNGMYEPSNCRWATVKQQNNNTRKNVILEYNGTKKTLAEWSELLKIKHTTIRWRIQYLHWSVEDALTKPVKVLRDYRKKVS